MISDGYIELGRRFVDFDARDISTLTMRMLGSNADRVTVGWDDLLRSRCSVVLGEPGCGKTMESKAKFDAIRAAGGHAFYRTLSDLCRDRSPLLPLPERPAFDAWRGTDAECVFVLDSLDEARNAGGALTSAIDRLATDLQAEWRRVRVVLTCRVAEWRPEEDLAALAGYFPSLERVVLADGDGTPASVNAAPVARRRQRNDPTEAPPPVVRVVRMAVLSEEQAIELAKSRRARDLPRLRREVRRAGAWALLERPADVTWLVSSWNRRGSIGTLTQLMEDNVAARLKEHGPSRRRYSELSAECAARGARELALCGILSGERRVRTGEPGVGDAEGAIDLSVALPRLSSREHIELAERAIFVDDGQGCRRLHHRATEEYLAAKSLFDTLGNQSGGSALSDFLVRERYGRRVVPPSLRGVAGWVAGCDPGVRRALLDADPFVLMEAGDPAAISPGERRGALVRILDELESRPWRRESADHSDLARFACAELCDLIGERLRGPERRGSQLLLRLVWHGQLALNAGDALQLAAAPGTPPELRALAVRAAAAAGDATVRERVVRLVRGGRGSRLEVLFEAADELYPEFMTTSDFGTGIVAWAAAARASRSETSHWTWLLDREYDPRRHEELAAIVGPALVRRARAIPARRGAAGAPAVRLASVLRCLLERRLRDGVPARATLESWAPWLWALARVHEASDALRDLHRGVGELLGETPVRRHVLRWLVRHRVPREAAEPARPFAVFREEPHDLWRPHAGDFPWMIEELRAGKSARERLVWFGLAFQSCTSLEDVETVEAAAGAYPALAAEVALRRERRAAPPDPREEELRRREAEIEAEHAARERKNREDLTSLVDEVRRGSHGGALRFLVARMEDDRSSRWGHSDWRSLAAPFGDEVAEAAREGLKRAWRRFRPMLPHEREKPNEVEWFVPVGLSGLNIAFADGLEPDDLSEEDAERATAYALCEINDFPTWFGDLAAARPGAALRILAPVLEAEYAGTGASRECAVLDNLGYRDARVRRLVTPTLLALLAGRAPVDARALERALAAVEPDDVHRQPLLTLARARASLDGDDAAASWWRCLAGLDPTAAASILREASNRGAGQTALVDAVAALDWTAVGLDAPALADIVRSTYRVVAPSADIHRPSGVTYSPGPRDEAERKRSSLVGRLGDVPGEAAFRALLELADDPATSAHHDWFAGLAHARCERDAETLPLDLRQARGFIDAPEARFADADGFFGYALDRLEDLRRTVETGPFSCRTLLRTADEAGVQLFVANHLRHTTTRCSVVREEEMDLRKKPDIRLHSSLPSAVVGIEIKVADSWTLPQLEAALERQLVGQYLRDACSRHGVLLLVHSGEKRRWENGDRRIAFEAVVERLAERARKLADESGLRLRVTAIDCRECPTDGAG